MHCVADVVVVVRAVLVLVYIVLNIDTSAPISGTTSDSRRSRLDLISGRAVRITSLGCAIVSVDCTTSLT